MSNPKIHDASQRLCGYLDGTYQYKTYRCGNNGDYPSLNGDLKLVLDALPAWPVDTLEQG